MITKLTSLSLAPLPHASEHGRKLPGTRGAPCLVQGGVADARSDGYTDRRARRRPTEATPVPCPPGTNSDTPEVGAEMTAEGAAPAGGETAKSDPPRRPANGSESTGSSAAKRGPELSAGGCVAGESSGAYCQHDRTWGGPAASLHGAPGLSSSNGTITFERRVRHRVLEAPVLVLEAARPCRGRGRSRRHGAPGCAATPSARPRPAWPTRSMRQA